MLQLNFVNVNSLKGLNDRVLKSKKEPKCLLYVEAAHCASSEYDIRSVTIDPTIYMNDPFLNSLNGFRGNGP